MTAKTKISRIALIACLAALPVTGAMASETTELVEQMGDWGLYYNKEGAGNCLILKVDAEGRTWQIGADRETERAYLGVMARTGSDITDKSLTNAKIDLDGDMYEGEVKEFTNAEGIQGGYMWFNSLDFAVDLANKQTLRVMMEDGREIDLDLTGSKEAMEWALACQIVTTQ
jgi:hypothetical protein